MCRQKTAHIFVGDLPSEKAQYLKRHLLARGCSATKVAKGIRRAVASISPKKARLLEVKCPVTKAFVERYISNGHVVRWNLKDLREVHIPKIIGSGGTEATQQTSTSDDNGSKRFFADMITAVNSAPADCQTIKLGREKRSIPMRDFLAYLVNCLADGSLDLTIDYLAIHRSCWTVLERVQEACSVELNKLFYLHSMDSFHPDIPVMYLLGALAGMFEEPHMMQREELLATTLKALIKAGNVFEETIKSGALDEVSKSMTELNILWIPRNESRSQPGQKPEDVFNEWMADQFEAFLEFARQRR